MHNTNSLHQGSPCIKKAITSLNTFESGSIMSEVSRWGICK